MKELKDIERSIQKKYRKEIFSKFVRAINEFNLIYSKYKLIALNMFKYKNLCLNSHYNDLNNLIFLFSLLIKII